MAKGSNDLMNAASLLKKVPISRTHLWRLVNKEEIKPIVLGTVKLYSLREVRRILSKKKIKIKH